ncbi:uncharacterized protein LOC116113758 [Pistacia vera]|uniref:uncharacterized protein LOC116113758 n=1 Tax=Pistacia vera TaxID=55513 RepID=UPI001262FC49|nr:uncharacterized protein LOC116113758 [Pistacia vera]
MNSPTSSHAFQAIEGLKDKWYPKIHDGVYEAMRSLRGEDNILRTMEFKDFAKIFMGGSEFVGDNMGLMKLNQTFINEGFKEEEMVEDVNFEEVSDNLGEVVELQGGESKDFGELIELQAGGSENLEGFDQIVEDVNFEKVDEVIDNLGEVEELQGGRSKDFGEMEELQASESEIVEGFDQILENAELKGTEEKVEKLESFEDNQESEVVMEPVQEVNNVVAGGSKMVESERITDIETLNSEAESSSKEGLMEQIEMISFMAVVGVALLFVVKVSLLMAFNLTKRNIRKETPPIIRPCSNESGVMEKCNPEIPKEREEHAKCVDSFSSAIPLVNSIVADSKDTNQSRGPSIELLAEFEVGEISFSLRSCGMKKSRIEESEVSSHSVPLDKEFGNCSKAHSVSSHENFSEFSAMNSFSYAYITPEKKISKKEDVRDGEAKKVVITPVRRSSRLRNRAITSP